MNKWKIAFWNCFTILIIVSLLSTYVILDQGITLTYQREGYGDTQNDLEQLIAIINETDLTKSQIQAVVKAHNSDEYGEFNSDTIYLNKLVLIFRNNKLKKVEQQ